MTAHPTKNLFLQALLFSFALHGVLAFWIDGRLVSPPPRLSSSLELLKEREIKNLALREAFQKQEPSAQKNVIRPVPEQFQYHLATKLNTADMPLLSLQITLPFPVTQFTLPPPSFSTSFNLPRDIPIPETKIAAPITSTPINIPLDFVEQPLAQLEPVEMSLEIPEMVFDDATPTPPTPSNRSFGLPALPSLSQLEVLSRADWFDTELLFLPIDGEEGAQFAVTLVANGQVPAPRLPQDFLFLIDRSNSIQKERLFATKQALARALNELDPKDRFNIVAFDSKVDKLFTLPMHPTGQNLDEAIQFLNSIDLGSFFSPSDLYRPLLFSLPAQTTGERLTHIVLLTDGEALQKKAIQKAILQDWTQRNQGSVSLYAIGLDSDPHIQTVDALCALNRGKLLTAPTHRGLRKKLLKFIKMVENPIASEVSVTAINKRTGKSIPLSRQNHPCLFLGQPTVLLGSIEKLDDFILFVQAKVDGKWIHVKKNLSFLHAKRGGRTVRTEIALQKAYEAYLLYSEDNDVKHLAEARSILEPFDLLPAFQ